MLIPKAFAFQKRSLSRQKIQIIIIKIIGIFYYCILKCCAVKCRKFFFTWPIAFTPFALKSESLAPINCWKALFSKGDLCHQHVQTRVWKSVVRCEVDEAKLRDSSVTNWQAYSWNVLMCHQEDATFSVDQTCLICSQFSKNHFEFITVRLHWNNFYRC